MIVALYLVAYIAIGSLVSFMVKILGYKRQWDRDDIKNVSTLAWIFWPIFCVVFIPITVLQKLSAILDAKAREISRK